MEKEHIGVMGQELLEIDPRELRFSFELKKQSSCLVQLSNNSDHYVAFKVKTTNPKKYIVWPNVGVVVPKSALYFTVILQPQRVDLSNMRCRDKFLVQSTVVPYGTKVDEIQPEFFSRESGRFIEEKKMKVVLYASSVLHRNGSLEKTDFGACRRQEPSVQEENYVVDESLGLKDTVVNEYFDMKKVGIIKDYTGKNTCLSKDQYSARVENTHQPEVPDDIKELKLQLQNLKFKLNESENFKSALMVQKSTINKEKKKLQNELVALRRDAAHKVQVGYPTLFVCFIGLVGIALGYLLHP